MVVLIFIFIFILGLCIGSFVNVVAERLPIHKSFMNSRSHCPKCKYTLQAIDLIPVISYALLLGKCRRCHTKLSLLYPFSELLTALVFVLVLISVVGLKIDENTISLITEITLFYQLIISSLLMIVFLTDIYYGIIPNRIILIGVIISFVFLIVLSPTSLMLHLLSALGAALFFFLLTIITRGKGMGLGDMKLAFLMGLFLGFPGITIALYTAFLTGAFVAGILIVWGKKKFHGSTIPFGPFLVTGTFIALVLQQWILPEVFHILGVN